MNDIGVLFHIKFKMDTSFAKPMYRNTFLSTTCVPIEISGNNVDMPVCILYEIFDENGDSVEEAEDNEYST